MASPAGFEPTAPGSGILCSILLSYGDHRPADHSTRAPMRRGAPVRCSETSGSERNARMAARTAPSHIALMKETHTIDRLPDELLWQLVLTRQPGDFLYAVTTMGVYCRPGCPSPRPLRKNVRFFRNPRRRRGRRLPRLQALRPEGRAGRLAQAVVRDACAAIEASEKSRRSMRWRPAPATRASISCGCFVTTLGSLRGPTPRACAPVNWERPWRRAPGWRMRWPRPASARKAASTKRPEPCSA